MRTNKIRFRKNMKVKVKIDLLIAEYSTLQNLL